MDYREKDAYVKHKVELFDARTHTRLTSEALVYVGMKEAHIDQSEDLEYVARWIASRQGPSGTNAEYALMLQNALSREGLHDDHIFGVVQWLYHV